MANEKSFREPGPSAARAHAHCDAIEVDPRLQRLLRFATSAALRAKTLDGQRSALLGELISATCASAGFWGWGRCKLDNSRLAPIATIPVGLPPKAHIKAVSCWLESLKIHLEWPESLTRHACQWQVSFGQCEPTADSTRREERAGRDSLASLGLSDMLCSLRGSSQGCWYCLTLFKPALAPPFTHADGCLMHSVLAYIDWLEPRVSPSFPQAILELGTARQRMVLLQLLDGVPRKQIATAMGITLHTVNDHIKALYERFEVNSATELAAKFLKSI